MEVLGGGVTVRRNKVLPQLRCVMVERQKGCKEEGDRSDEDEREGNEKDEASQLEKVHQTRDDDAFTRDRTGLISRERKRERRCTSEENHLKIQRNSTF